MRGKNWKLCLALAAVLLPVLAWLGRAGAGPAGKVSIFNARLGRVEVVEKVRRTDREWRKLLTPKAYRVTRLKETDLPYREQCSVPAPGEVGVYQCVGCGTDLFPAGTKFESGSGWPSFQAPVSELNIRVQTDRSHGRLRSEVLCARCDAHLGHVFDDGPPPAGKRYCINSTALVLFKTGRPLKRLEAATFAAGCFWGVEEAFRRVPGVVSTAVGFTGGWLKGPTYEDVCRKNTGHAEAVRLEYDPARVSYEELLEVFWSIHDPTTPDRQGVDVGPQYRSVIFYHDARQEKAARLSAQKAARSGKFAGPIVTRIVEAGPFYRAEEYHQRYYEKRGIEPACRF